MGIQGPVLDERSQLIALSKQEAAQMLGVSPRTIDRLIALKELQVRRLGRRVLNSKNCSGKLPAQRSPHANILTSS